MVILAGAKIVAVPAGVINLNYLQKKVEYCCLLNDDTASVLMEYADVRANVGTMISFSVYSLVPDRRLNPTSR